ncbi:MAG: hypothetical protein ABIP38_12955 [Steroidobacteraceae bacterium]
METAAVPAQSVRVRTAIGHDEKFYFVSAILMAVVLVAGFSTQLALGRSSFDVPLRFHLHGLLFFGWTTLYVMQNTLVASGSVAMHRRLGWLATVWIPLMVISGIFLTVVNIRTGRVPGFFEPVLFLHMNTLGALCFLVLGAAAIQMRRNTQWHRRLMFCAMATILAPGFGRLLPMPFLIPWADWATTGASLLFPVAGVIRDVRKDGRVHPAWWWGLGALLGTQLLVRAMAHSALGLSIYQAVTSGAVVALPALQFQMPIPGG